VILAHGLAGGSQRSGYQRGGGQEGDQACHSPIILKIASSSMLTLSVTPELGLNRTVESVRSLATLSRRGRAAGADRGPLGTQAPGQLRPFNHCGEMKARQRRP
jgi:hypothetical protein